MIQDILTFTAVSTAFIVTFYKIGQQIFAKNKGGCAEKSCNCNRKTVTQNNLGNDKSFLYN